MSVHQTELNSVWQAHLKGKKEKGGGEQNTMGSCLFRSTYSNVTQHYRHTHYYCTVASSECLWWMFGFFCSHFNKCHSLSAGETLALIFHEASPIWIGSVFLGEKKPWSQVDAIIVPMWYVLQLCAAGSQSQQEHICIIGRHSTFGRCSQWWNVSKHIKPRAVQKEEFRIAEIVRSDSFCYFGFIMFLEICALHSPTFRNHSPLGLFQIKTCLNMQTSNCTRSKTLFL